MSPASSHLCTFGYRSFQLKNDNMKRITKCAADFIKTNRTLHLILANIHYKHSKKSTFLNDICRALVIWAVVEQSACFPFCVFEILLGCRALGESQLLGRSWQFCMTVFIFLVVGAFVKGIFCVSVHLDHVWPLALDLWHVWRLCSSEHKDHSERKHRDKEKLKHSDGSSEKHREKHKERDKEKRREEKVCKGIVSLPLWKAVQAFSITLMLCFLITTALSFCDINLKALLSFALMRKHIIKLISAQMAPIIFHELWL